MADTGSPCPLGVAWPPGLGKHAVRLALCVIPNTNQMPKLVVPGQGHEDLPHREKGWPHFPIPTQCAHGKVQVETLWSYLMGELKK